MAAFSFKIEPPERTVKHALVYRGTITGDASHPAEGYPLPATLGHIDFIVFNGVSTYLWDFDKDTQAIQVFKITSSVRAIATGDDLDAESMNFEAFKYVG